MFISKQICLTE